jgi:hypothetical protein
MPIDRLFRYLLTPLLMISALVLTAAAHPRIIPLHTNINFPAQSPFNHWSVPIKATNQRTAYVLSLEPDFTVGNHLAVLKVVLHRFGDKSDAPNLLDPPGIWHGLQPCDFVANDLSRGVQNSVFGEKRAVIVKRVGLKVRLAASKATVSPISAGDYQLDTLDLHIDVENSKP